MRRAVAPTVSACQRLEAPHLPHTQVRDIELGGESLGFCGVPGYTPSSASGCRVAVDTGTSLFTGPGEPPPPCHSPHHQPHPALSLAAARLNRKLSLHLPLRPGEQIRELSAGLRRQLGPDCDTSGLPDLTFEAQAFHSPLPRCTRAAPALHPRSTCAPLALHPRPTRAPPALHPR